ncbi:Stk1 family PASTA domain-containing Ser/Thr kinase [Listeria weihenstephanensis]|uniref:Serine/threonine-protein kinase PrkC n=1 Tax=Listeria weihenstephanensis TaxID=1006155 RepID=A0A841Z5U3_9LIST|nr:Stk1 family PASTA domain-containing Ser/Thr kinase [Listeria weihenstephanensis]MBC1499837.1 Stk1 family PASTA domain-containing Ser/Thr kinase [Listeria weihenstephanensis]
MMIGKRINDRYKVVSAIGGGGMANVFLAHDMILDRNVAVKVLRIDLADESNLIRRFQREAQSATSLVHPNIVSIYDVGEENDLHYIVMEYVEGMDLKQYIHENHPIPFEKTVDIMLQIVSAVAVAHSAHIVHRDLKPQNILIDHDGVVKITDFGIAMALSETSITQTNSLLGSVHYLSPEQARGGMATQKSDIYSLGIVLYELLIGKVPYDGESAVSIAIKHLQASIPSIREQNPEVPQSLENIVIRATAKDPFLRYQTAEEMEIDLKTALDPERRNEEKYVFPMDDGETKTIPIIAAKNMMQNLDNTVVATEEKPEAPAEKPKKKKSNKKKIWIISGITLLFVIIIALLWYFGRPPATMKIPNVANDTKETAVQKLQSAGFNVGESFVKNSDKIEEGKVIETDPEIGAAEEKGSTVNLYVSIGAKKITVTDYTGKSYDTVKQVLDQQGYKKVSYTEEYSDSVDSGVIISQDPTAGSEVVVEDTEISFVVSKGERPLTLKDLSGFNQVGLDDYASSNDITITTSSEDYSDTVGAGQVISQKPEAGATINKGDKVTVVMSKGPKEKEVKTVKRTISIPYEPEDPDATPPVAQHIQIYIQDKTHSMTSAFKEMDITKNTTENLSFEIEEGTQGGYKVVRDNTVILEETIEYPN